ncbi:VPLPA-CTERM sorting domain-containing protein [Roseobacter sp.]|uniref:VPLPA-CTERM sorting domain-containing protein n=1 Tax=Roseobacter sp. TaxID=1907202 RepID=UPI003299FAD5
MRHIFAAAGLVALSVTTLGSAASAATATFEFGCGGGVVCDSPSSSNSNVNSLSSSFDLTDGGLTVTASAGFFEGGVSFLTATNIITSADPQDNAKIGRFVGGAGVFSAPDGNHTVDGFDTNNDFIKLSFSQDVALSEIGFGFFGRNDDFRYLYDVDGDGDIDEGDFLSDQFAVVDPFADVAPASSSVWAVAAFGANDSWKLSSVTVSFDDASVPLAPVPLPAAGWMLLAALGGMAGVRRRFSA